VNINFGGGARKKPAGDSGPKERACRRCGQSFRSRALQDSTPGKEGFFVAVMARPEAAPDSVLRSVEAVALCRPCKARILDNAARALRRRFVKKGEA